MMRRARATLCLAGAALLLLTAWVLDTCARGTRGNSLACPRHMPPENAPCDPGVPSCHYTDNRVPYAYTCRLDARTWARLQLNEDWEW